MQDCSNGCKVICIYERVTCHSLRPVARFFGFWGANTLIGGQVFRFYYMFKQFFVSTTKFGSHKKFGGTLAPNVTPWLPACTAYTPTCQGALIVVLPGHGLRPFRHHQMGVPARGSRPHPDRDPGCRWRALRSRRWRAGERRREASRHARFVDATDHHHQQAIRNQVRMNVALEIWICLSFPEIEVKLNFSVHRAFFKQFCGQVVELSCWSSVSWTMSASCLFLSTDARWARRRSCTRRQS